MAKYEISDEDWLRLMRALRTQRDAVKEAAGRVRALTSTDSAAERAVLDEAHAIERLHADLIRQAEADEAAKRAG